MKPTIDAPSIEQICNATHHDPFSVLGMHRVTVRGKPAVAVRSFQPAASGVSVVHRETRAGTPMTRLFGGDFFEAVFTGVEAIFPYDLTIHRADGTAHITPDPYSFLPVLSDFDLQLLGEGNHLRSHEKLGAHVRTVQGITGTHFAVWAPNAHRVSLVGEFNSWDGRRHAMRTLGGSGIWEVFVPGLGPGTLYKYEVKGIHGQIVTKADPHAYYSELRPSTASVIWDLSGYEWSDDAWCEQRTALDPLTSPLSIYEVHLGSWMRVPEEDNRWLTYRELAHKLGDYVAEMGYTHVELLPITEHPHDGSWGYQCIGYFAPTSRFGNPDDFRYFVDELHRRGIGVILDWVPAHFPKDAHGLARFDGSALYEHEDPRLGEHQDWGTYIFNYGRTEVCNFLLSSALFWLGEYHLDGLRVDAVASMLYLDYSREEGQWVPNEFGGRENLAAIAFIKRLNELCHEHQPGTMIFAEESTSFPAVSKPLYDGGLGFTFKWNMGWMHDTLEYIARDPIHRSHHYDQLSFGMLYAFTENFVLPISHDEVVHMKGSMIGKMPGDEWQQFANLRLYYGFQWTMPGKKLLFMGQDFGQHNEWNDHQSLDWNLLNFPNHSALKGWVRDLNMLYRDHGALHQQDTSWQGFQWLQVEDAGNSVLAFCRRGTRKDGDPGDHLVIACNFTPVVREGYRLGVPIAGPYLELLNSDADVYCGSGVGNAGQVHAAEEPTGDQPATLTLTLPPLSLLILKPAAGLS